MRQREKHYDLDICRVLCLGNHRRRDLGGAGSGPTPGRGFSLAEFLYRGK